MSHPISQPPINSGHPPFFLPFSPSSSSLDFPSLYSSSSTTVTTFIAPAISVSLYSSFSFLFSLLCSTVAPLPPHLLPQPRINTTTAFYFLRFLPPSVTNHHHTTSALPLFSIPHVSHHTSKFCNKLKSSLSFSFLLLRSSLYFFFLFSFLHSTVLKSTTTVCSK